MPHPPCTTAVAVLPPSMTGRLGTARPTNQSLRCTAGYRAARVDVRAGSAEEYVVRIGSLHVEGQALAVIGRRRFGCSSAVVPFLLAVALTTGCSVDVDGDGLPDREERVLGTSTELADTDGDGLSDAEEVFDLGTDPLSSDTDGDGLSDGAEVELGTDPTAADTDGDGLDDGDEVQIHKTDPNKKDTDGDGVNDGTEVAAGTDPNDATSQ